jgi:cyclohexanecarboxyl-CoA dehydrogenase
LVNHQAGVILDEFAANDLKTRWLPGIIQGDTIPCIASTEPSSSWDFDALTTRAEQRAGRYLISGCKAPVSFGMAADMAVTIVQAVSTGPMAIALPLDLPGIHRSEEQAIGLALAAPAVFQLNDVAVPSDYRIGEGGEGRQVAIAAGPLSSVNQIAVGLICLGMAQAALKAAVQYAKERRAFGKPIAKFQGISQKIAEDATLIEAGRWLCYRALSLKDNGRDCQKEAAMCGWWCPKISCQVIQNSLLIHGHAGYSDDHPFGRMLKDVVGFEMISGAESLQKMVIGDRILGLAGVTDGLLNLVASL